VSRVPIGMKEGLGKGRGGGGGKEEEKEISSEWKWIFITRARTACCLWGMARKEGRKEGKKREWLAYTEPESENSIGNLPMICKQAICI